MENEKITIHSKENYQGFNIYIVSRPSSRSEKLYYSYKIAFLNGRLLAESNTWEFFDSVNKMTADAKEKINEHLNQKFNVGDLVKNPQGSVGIVVDATPNSYAIDFFDRSHGGNTKHAWWTDNEGLIYLGNAQAILRSERVGYYNNSQKIDRLYPNRMFNEEQL